MAKWIAKINEEEARENLEDYYGYYDTFQWLEPEE